MAGRAARRGRGLRGSAPVREGLAARWLDGYDWRHWETRLNEHPQFTTAIDGQNVHFLHVRSPEANALPLVLTHGWPGSIVEFVDVIGPLSDPRRHGGDPADAFHLVIPSLPGHGFSGPTLEKGGHNGRIARAWAELMARLGYDRYGACGNDAGSLISPELGRIDADRVVGVHVTQIFSFPTGDSAEMADLTPDEQGQLGTLQWFYENKFSFNTLMSQQPQTLGYSVCDSPVGLLGVARPAAGPGPRPRLRSHQMDAATASSRAPWPRLLDLTTRRGICAADVAPTTVPIGLAGFGGDFYGIRRFAERDHQNIVRWTTYDHGGHFAAHKVPDLLVNDIRQFFRTVGR